MFMGWFESDMKKEYNYVTRIWIRYIDNVFAVFNTIKCNFGGSYLLNNVSVKISENAKIVRILIVNMLLMNVNI